jgi:hypothetical protein
MIAVWKWATARFARLNFHRVDASVRRDSTACVCIRYDETTDALLLADYKSGNQVRTSQLTLRRQFSFICARFEGTRLECGFGGNAQRNQVIQAKN